MTENGEKNSTPPPPPDSVNDSTPASNASTTLVSNISSASAATSATNASAPGSREESPRIDNRNLCDRDANQRLGRDDIEELRAQGKRGHEIIGHLVNNSLTFKVGS